ncbi:hypothetical protein [Sphingomonas sp.]|uniref:hypothetical protein n=1 Tax=Sphingomonas sp. TaxID=28214 RepID=UPI0025D31B2B|nr:hypothetical protein [Sphingomonas sp.]
MTDYMVEGLVKRRAQLAGDMHHAHERLRSLAVDLEHIDATLRLVAPDLVIEGIAPKLWRPPENWSKRGDMARIMLNILRMARQPMTTREIATQMIVERGVASDAKMLNLMSKRCATALRGLRERGHVRSKEGECGFWLLWELVR